MKKISKKDFSKIPFLILILGVFSSLMLFFPSLAYRDSSTTYTGLEVAFGTGIANLGNIVSGQIEANILAILAYLLPFIAGLIAVFVKRGIVISVVILAIAAALMFMLPEYTKVSVTILGSTTPINVNWSYAYGLIISAILSTLALLAGLYYLTYSKNQ